MWPPPGWGLEEAAEKGEVGVCGNWRPVGVLWTFKETRGAEMNQAVIGGES